MRLDQLILRSAASALLLLVAVVVLASPGDVVDVPVDQLLLGDVAVLVRIVAGATGVLVVLSAGTVGRALDPERRRRAVPVLLAGFGAALMVFAASTPDPDVAAAAGAPLVAAEPSTSAAVNTLALLLASTLLPAVMIVQAVRWRRDDETRRLATTAFVAVVASLWAHFAFSLTEDGTLGAAGLWQRLAFATAWVWLAVLLLGLAGRLTSGSAGTRT